jgi:tRNA (cmo5U34)-methyltransferase
MEGVVMHTTEQEGSRSSLGHMPNGRWTFDESVTAVFTDMLTRSIPQYEVMRKSVFDLGMALVPPGSTIVDLGCSRGDGLAPFIHALGDRSSYLGLDVSQPMLHAARQRFEKEIERGVARILDLDLRHGYPQVDAGLTLSVLSLHFTPIEHRQRILRDVYARTVPGGAFLMVEKILGATAEFNTQMVNLYHRFKNDAGYSAEEVERKKLSLEGVLVPLTARANEDFLRDAGFREVDCFWRWMNFAGWVATK